MAISRKKVKGVKDRKLTVHGVPVQAYIPREVYRKFKRMFPQHGAASKLIRKAFLLAVDEPEDAQLPRQAERLLPSPPREEPDESTQRDDVLP